MVEKQSKSMRAKKDIGNFTSVIAMYKNMNAIFDIAELSSY